MNDSCVYYKVSVSAWCVVVGGAWLADARCGGGKVSHPHWDRKSAMVATYLMNSYEENISRATFSDQ